MKIIKLMFSRFPILLLAFLLQIVGLAAIIGWQAQYFVWFWGVSLLFSLLVLLHMLNRDIAAEFKLPWMLLLIVSPIFGTVLYIFLANPKIGRRRTRALLELERHRDEYLNAAPADREATDRMLGDYRGIEQYLLRTAYSRGFSDNRVEYYGDGARFFDALSEALEGARSFIFLEYFIIERGALWDRIHAILRRKQAEGVEVRILYDDLGTLGKLTWHYSRVLTAEGLTARRFNPVRPILSGIYNYRDHRKIAVIDGKVSFTGGMNIGDEYAGITHPLGVWRDSGIRIEGGAVGNLTLLFLQLWATAGRGDTDCGRYFPPPSRMGKAEGYVHPFGSGPMPFYREQVAENTLLNLIGMAKRSVYITTPYLIVDRALLGALRNAAARGVDVRIVTPHVPDKRLVFLLTRASYRPLLEAGVRILEFTPGFLHAKQMLVDGEIAFVGTVNLDYRSLSHHFECGAILLGTPAIGDIGRDFEEIFSLSAEITGESFRLSPLARTAAALLSLISPLF